MEAEIIRGRSPAAWKALIYSAPGVGKSTLAAHAPRPLFLDLENGLSRIDCDKTPHLKSMEDVLKWLRFVLKSKDFDTAVLDTVDEVEKFLSAEVIAEWNLDARIKVKTVSDIPYGRGGDLLVAKWRGFIEVIEHLHAAGKNVLLIGHEQIVKFENPTGDNYDFVTVNVHKKAAPVVIAKLDAVFYARFETIVKDTDAGKGKAVATGRRILHTQHGASFVAKSRFNLPATVPMEPSLFERLS